MVFFFKLKNTLWLVFIKGSFAVCKITCKITTCSLSIIELFQINIVSWLQLHAWQEKVPAGGAVQ